jgi:hypothetical protein
VRFFFDRLFFAFAALRVFLLEFFAHFLAFLTGFRGFFGSFALLARVIFGFELAHEAAQRSRARLSRCRHRAFGRFDFACAAAASSARDRGGDEQDHNRSRTFSTSLHTNLSARAVWSLSVLYARSPSSSRSASSSRVAIPSRSAFASLEPGLAPSTT